MRGASGAGKTTLLELLARLRDGAGVAQALPRGLDTPLGSRGHGLSGGQAQRVALARLFLRDPGLILLDEPAAHLDAATQARVLDEVLAFAQGRTLLLATHADAVARRLPRQWMLEQGRLRELQPA
ncbi:ABC transporter ATP-binding protein [Bordetella pertussis]|nr:ABC transporter ATP-binding protein [Bordetella pertussis]